MPKRTGTFPTTQWSMVLDAGNRNVPGARLALESLCVQYWYPTYLYVRRSGRNHHEAEDLTQDFFARLIAMDSVARARPERGRFRTFLLTSLKNFLTNEWHRAHTAKRGNGVPTLSLDLSEADERFAREQVGEAVSPELAFDQSWALEMIDRALADLALEYQRGGRGALFEAIAPIVWGGGPQDPLAVQAERIGMNEGAFKVAVHRLRRRLRERLTAMVAETVDDPVEADAELRHLIASVS